MACVKHPLSHIPIKRPCSRSCPPAFKPTGTHQAIKYLIKKRGSKVERGDARRSAAQIGPRVPMPRLVPRANCLADINSIAQCSHTRHTTQLGAQHGSKEERRHEGRGCFCRADRKPTRDQLRDNIHNSLTTAKNSSPTRRSPPRPQLTPVDALFN
jgi:hypothetical protein